MTQQRHFADVPTSFAALPAEIAAEQIGDATGKLVFEIHDAGTWTLTLDRGQATVTQGDVENWDVKVTTDSAHWLAIAEGSASARRLFMTGKIKVKGRLALAIKLDKLFTSGS